MEVTVHYFKLKNKTNLREWWEHTAHFQDMSYIVLYVYMCFHSYMTAYMQWIKTACLHLALANLPFCLSAILYKENSYLFLQLLPCTHLSISICTP